MREGIRALGILAFLGLFICGSAQAVTINFDDVIAPSLFSGALALKNEYSSQGVSFDGPQPKYGGAILNQGGNFGVNALSGINFLAFNRQSGLQDGGIPTDPETITFKDPVTNVSIWAAGGFTSDTFTLAAYDESDFLLGSASITTLDWGKLEVLASGIKKVVLTQQGNDGAFVYDDLSFGGGAPAVPEPMTMILLGSGLAGLVITRRRLRK